jgi:hypothetical protein
MSIDSGLVVAFTPHVLVDVDGNELGRCGFEGHPLMVAGHTLGLGPMGFFRILDAPGGEPFVLVVEPVSQEEAKRPQRPS